MGAVIFHVAGALGNADDTLGDAALTNENSRSDTPPQRHTLCETFQILAL